MDTRQVSGAPTTHNRKRHADDILENEQRLSKRFNLLNLGELSVISPQTYDSYAFSTAHNGRLYIPVEQPKHSHQPIDSGDSMRIDDTKDKVYIYNLDDEVSDIESEEEKLVFLPDIEKRLSKIPKHVLTGRSPPTTSNEMILYSVPESLSIPREQDNVRKAIIETRARARDRQAQEAEAAQSQMGLVPEKKNRLYHYAQDQRGSVSVAVVDDNDEDAMDIG
ncbi:hypothetical protein MMC24_000544 [Lignoscripta atroalba]|nr:hypothetical protein [Lignoscripta atroalba]